MLGTVQRQNKKAIPAPMYRAAPQQPGGKARLGAERPERSAYRSLPANTPTFTLAWRHSPACWQRGRSQQELARHRYTRPLGYVPKASGEWDAGAGTQCIPADGTQHPHVEELPRCSGVILKPGVEHAVVFVQVSRVLNGRMRGLTPLCRVKRWRASFIDGGALGQLVALGSHWCCWRSGRS